MAKKSVVIRADIKDLELATADDLVKSEQLRNLIMWSVPRTIEYAHNSNKQHATVFEIGTTGHYLEIHRSQWIPSLQTVMDFKMEQDTKDSYEECAKIRDLIAKIRSSTKPTKDEEPTVRSTEDSSGQNT